MAIRCNVDELLALYNLERIRAREKPLSVRKLAKATNIAHSSLVNLVNNRTTRIDLDTLTKLMTFFGTKDVNDILVWVDE